MRIRQGYMLNETENSRTVVPMNPAAGGFQGSIRLNASAAMLYRMLENDASEDDLTNAAAAYVSGNGGTRSGGRGCFS